MTVQQSREHIRKIRERREDSHAEVLDSLAGAIDRLEKAFPGQWHFLMEFIQNADDADSTAIAIDISRNEIRIRNDGHPFDRADVESICKVGRSSKTYTEKGEDYIGYLGVGFKSVFLISDNPQIYSRDYRFAFGKHAWDQHEATPWQIYPKWIDGAPRDTLEGEYNTEFRIPVSDSVDDEMFEKVIDEVSAEQVSDRTLLFLPNLDEIEIKDRVRDVKKRIVKTQVETSPEYEIYRIDIYIDGEREQANNWLIFRNSVTIPSEIKDHPLTERWERDGLDAREVMVGIKLDDHGLVKEEGTAHMGVFSYLPLKEEPSELNFLVQADFLTAPGREVIHREAPWNEWLAGEVYNLLIEQAIPCFKRHDNWKYTFTDVLYPGESGHEIFNKQIHEPLQTYLQNNPVLVDYRDQFANPQNTVTMGVGRVLQAYITESDLESLYPEKTVLHSDCEIPPEIRWKLTKGPGFSSKRGVNRDLQRLLRLKADHADFPFFNELYTKLNDYAESTLSGSPFGHQKIVLTENLDVREPGSVYFPSDNVDIPDAYRDHFPLIPRQIAAEPDSRELLKRLGAKELTEEAVQRVLDAEEVPANKEEWQHLSDDEKIRTTRICKELWVDRQLEMWDLSFLTVKTSSSAWEDPEKVVFSNAYNPDHSIETLEKNGLLSGQTLFLSVEYIRTDDAIEEWRDFFDRLGVEDNVDKKNYSEEVAVQTALQFEEDQGRAPRTLAQFEERASRTGYDIESGDGERLIEVKGRSSETPQINLTANQFQRLKDSDERYYIYVVQDALNDPRLCVLHCDDIVDFDWSITIRYNDWESKCRYNYRPSK